MKNKFLIGIEWEPQFTLLNYPNHSVSFKTNNKAESSINTIFNTGVSPGGLVPVQKDQEFKHVNVVLDSSYNIWRSTKVATNNNNKKNKYRYMSIDEVNFEVITKPVTLSKISSEIDRATKHLESFCNDIFNLVGPLGVFLPVWNYTWGQPSKHVNISKSKPFVFKYSYHDECDKLGSLATKKGFVTKIMDKSDGREHSSRTHITVPYNFTEYEELSTLFYDKTVDLAEVISYLYKWSLQNPIPYMEKTNKRGIFLGFNKGNGYIRARSLL